MNLAISDKTAETLAAIACLIVLVALVYLSPEYNTVLIPAILAVVVALTGAEAGRRHGKRTYTPSDARPSSGQQGRTDGESTVGYDTNEEYRDRARRRE